MKKRYITLLSFLIFVLLMTAQNRNLVDVRSTSEKTETDWSRQINEISQTQPIVLAEGISYNANARDKAFITDIFLFIELFPQKSYAMTIKRKPY